MPAEAPAAGQSLHWIEILLKDPTASNAILFVLICFVLSLIAAAWMHRRLGNALHWFNQELPDRLDRWRPGTHEADPVGFSRDIEDVILFRDDKRRLVISEAPEASMKKRLLVATRSGVLGWWLDVIGDHLTAIALVLTFVLLGYVLVGPIYLAVSNDDTKGPLATALQQMGAKFFVSASGLLFASLFQLVSRRSQELLQDRVTATIRSVSGKLVLLEHFHAETARATAMGLDALRKETQERLDRHRTEELERLDCSEAISLMG